MPEGPVIAIGGHEDREGERTILRAVADHCAGRRLLLLTAATADAQKYVDAYARAFADLDVELVAPDVETLQAHPQMIDGVGGVFISGGDQSRLADTVIGSALEKRIIEVWREGAVVAGTSAGASVLGATMLLRGPAEESPERAELHLVPGLGLVADMIIDQHFAERGRIGRLFASLAEGAEPVGVGLDENTALHVVGATATVIGAGAVTILDAGHAAWPATRHHDSHPMSGADLVLHVLSEGDRFDLDTRRASLA